MGTSAKVARYSLSEVASFSTAAPTAASTWLHVPALDAPLPKLEQATDVAQESDSDGASSVDYPTVKGSALSLTTRVHTGTKSFDGASGDTDPTTCFLKPALESYFGAGATSFSGTTIASGTTAAPTLTTATGVAAGMALQFGSQVRFVAGVSGSSVTLDSAIDAATAGLAVYGAFNFAPTLGERAAYHYVSAEVGNYSGLVGPGRVVGLKIQGGAAKGGLRYALDFAADSWGTSVTPSSLAYTVSSYTGPTLVGKGAEVALDGASVTAADVAIDFGCKHEEIVAVSGSNGRQGWQLNECEPSVEFSEYFASARWTNFTSRSGVSVRIVVPGDTTSAATRARTSLAVWLPNAQVTVEPATVGGQRAQKVKLVGKRPTPAQKLAGVTSPVYLAVFGGA